MTIQPDKLEIRALALDDSLEALTVLLHRAYSALADMGLKYLATHQSVEMTKKRIDSGTCFVAVYAGRIVGTITCQPPGHFKDKGWLSADGVAHIEQLGVEPEFQKQGIANRLMDRAEALARENGVKHLALDTAVPAKHLIAWYERRGYKTVDHVNWDITNYESVIMSKEI